METHLEIQGDFGSIGVRTVDESGNVHRRVVEPGSWEDGRFVPNLLTGEPDEVVALAAKTWTPEIVAAWQARLEKANEPEPAVIPDRVTSRQFKLQLLAEGLIDQVEAWVASQGRAIQLAYDNSGTFARDESMLQAGFRALGFTEEQGNAFFSAASKR